MQPNLRKFEFINNRPNLRPTRILDRYYFMRLSVHGIVVFLSLKDFISACKYYSKYHLTRPHCTISRRLNSMIGLPEVSLYGIRWAAEYQGTLNNKPCYHLFQRHRVRFVLRTFLHVQFE